MSITDATLLESALSSAVSEGSLEGPFNEVSRDMDSMHNESEQQLLVCTAVSTKLTSSKISRLQEESQINKEELCKLRRELNYYSETSV